MARLVGAGIVLAAGLALACEAQFQETMTYSIEWEKGVVAPGEVNKATVWATLSPEIGSPVVWNPTGTGTGQPGILKAFASTIFNFKNVANGLNGTIVNATVPPEFAIAPSPIVLDGLGGCKVTAGQLGPPANPNPNVNQYVAVLTFEWLAGDTGQAYDVMYATQANSAKVLIDVGLSAWVSDYAEKVNGQGGFTVTPSPTTVAAVVPFLMMCITRRRRP